jgi:hypothetical protein
MPKFKKTGGFKLKSGNKTSFKMMGSSPAKDTNPHTGMNPPHGAHSKKKESTLDKVKKHVTDVVGAVVSSTPTGLMTKKVIDAGILSGGIKGKTKNITKKDIDRLEDKDKVDTKATQYQEEKVTDLPKKVDTKKYTKIIDKDKKDKERKKRRERREKRKIENKKKNYWTNIKNKKKDTKDTTTVKDSFRDRKHPEGTPLEK